MRVPLNWLRDYVDLVVPVPQLVERLTLAGLEVTGVQLIGVPPPEGLRLKGDEVSPVWDRDKVFVGEVVEVQKHPNADRLTIVTVAYGDGRTKTMVTGAPNLKVGDRGQKVVLALAGAVLIDGYAKERVLRPLKPAKIRGVASDAMVCSEKELGLSDEHEGILILDDDAPVGQPLVDFMGDVVLDIDVLPNMARCLSMIGVAREVAALTDQTLRLPAHTLPESGSSIEGRVNIRIDDAELCRRYAAAMIENVRHRLAPAWMRRRLTLAGMRPIGNIVDITNYVMLEWGQPLHAFDYDKLVERAGGQTPTIIVRTARPGESIKTLDGVDRNLSPDTLLIADTAGPIAIAGVMGGAETEVTETTRNILLESAHFNYIRIRRTARALDLPSEASLRFSRGVHPEMVRPAAQRAADLMTRHADGSACRDLADVYPAPIPPQTIQLPMAEVRRILGIPLPLKEATRIFRALEFQVREHGDETLEVTTPQHRMDIQHGTADLIEELARVHGYDRLDATLIRDALPEQHTNRPLMLEEQTRDILVAAGLQEVITYSLTTPEREQPILGESVDYVRIANPISSERVVMRRSVLASVLEIAASNLRHHERVRLFEIGLIYVPKADAELPDELLRLAIVMTGPRQSEFWGDDEDAAEPIDFFDLKGVIENLVAELHVGPVAYQRTEAAFLHPGQAAEVVIGKKPCGRFGQLHPGWNDSYDLGRRRVFVAELDLAAILEAVPPRYDFQPVPEYPPVRQDIAIVVDESVPAARVAEEIQRGGGPLLRQVRLFDLYRGPNIPPGKKSLAYALTYQALDRTLTDKEVAKVHAKIVSRLEKVLQAKLRG